MASIHPATQSPRGVRAGRDVPGAALLGILPCNIRACGIFHTPFPSDSSLEFLAAHTHWHAHFSDRCCSGALLSWVKERDDTGGNAGKGIALLPQTIILQMDVIHL